MAESKKTKALFFCDRCILIYRLLDFVVQSGSFLEIPILNIVVILSHRASAVSRSSAFVFLLCRIILSAST